MRASDTCSRAPPCHGSELLPRAVWSPAESYQTWRSPEETGWAEDLDMCRKQFTCCRFQNISPRFHLGLPLLKFHLTLELFPIVGVVGERDGEGGRVVLLSPDKSFFIYNSNLCPAFRKTSLWPWSWLWWWWSGWYGDNLWIVRGRRRPSTKQEPLLFLIWGGSPSLLTLCLFVSIQLMII